MSDPISWNNSNQMDNLMNQAMKTALDQDSPDEAITKFISELGPYSFCERIMVFEDIEKKDNPVVFSWEKEGLESEMNIIDSLTRQEYDWLYSVLERDGFIYVEDRNIFKDSNPDIYEILTAQKIQRLYISPLILKGKLIGFYYIENPPEMELLHATEFIELFGSFLISLLKFRKIFIDLETTSQRDLMTQLYNRVTGQKKIEELLSMGIEGMFLMMDGDHFKTVNDTFGHAAGDQVILALADSIHKVFDTVGIPLRLGGDEFAVFVPAFTDEKDASYVIKELVKNISKINIPALNGKMITASIGVAFTKKGENLSLDELYSRADSALYRSKAAKGNKVTFF